MLPGWGRRVLAATRKRKLYFQLRFFLPEHPPFIDLVLVPNEQAAATVKSAVHSTEHRS